MPRYHRVVLAYEGECSLCGACCGTCDRLKTKGDVKICKDHGKDKPSHCILFPLGYSVELMPESCSLVPTELVDVDETVHTHRIQVAGRTSLALFEGATEEDDEEDDETDTSEMTLHELQGHLESEHEKKIYRRIPDEHLDKIIDLAEKLARLEDEEGDGPDEPLSWQGAAKSEELLKDLILTAHLYATRRDLIVGDLFDE
ncbi:MAG: hypothetical protein GF320_02710 [Armatimonadia bacterium]|nr:hypothetical protein [Armatimonadia bacterium]